VERDQLALEQIEQAGEPDVIRVPYRDRIDHAATIARGLAAALTGVKLAPWSALRAQPVGGVERRREHQRRDALVRRP
jgi:hypothetical protein